LEPTSGKGTTPTAPPLSEIEAANELERVRDRISEIDERLIHIIGERRDLVLEVGRLKAILNLPVMDPGREAQVVRKAAARARELGVDEEMTRDVIWRIMASARSTQEEKPGGSVPPE
jgi:chorismate mutase